MLVVPCGFIGALFEFEAEVLPIFDVTDPGERHPESLFRRTAAEMIRENPVVLREGGTKAPFRIEREFAKTQNVNFLGSLELDRTIAESCDKGNPFVSLNSKNSTAFEEITKKIMSFCAKRR